MLDKINRTLEKILPFITPISVFVGVLLSSYLVDLKFLIPWVFALMTLAGSLNSNLTSFKGTLQNPFTIFVALFILHILMPLWALGAGTVFFQGEASTITGIVLGMVIPTGITSAIWVSIYRGNMALTLSIIIIDTILSPLLVPFTLSLIVGKKVDIDMSSIMLGLMWMVVFPSIIGMTLNQLTKGKAKDLFSRPLAPFTKLGMAFVVMVNSAVVAPYLRNVNLELILIGLAVFFVAASGYLFSFLIGMFLKQNRDNVIALTFTGGMRNISAGAVIAVSYFAPAVAVPVVVGMLFQQVLASTYGYFVNRYFDKKDATSTLPGVF